MSDISRPRPKHQDDGLEGMDSAAESAAAATAPPETLRCQGINLQYYRNSTSRLNGTLEERQKRADELVLNFKNACREAFSWREKLSHPTNDRWKYCLPVVGALVNLNSKENEVRWTVEELAHDPQESQYDYLSIRAVGCTKGELEDSEVVCKECAAWRDRLRERLDQQKSSREREFDPNTRRTVMSKTWSLDQKHTNHHKRMSGNKSLKIKRRDKIIKLLKDSTGVDIDVTAGGNAVFTDEAANHVEVFCKRHLTKDSLVAYAFNEAVRTQKQAQKSGRKSVRHCPAIIRLAAIVYHQMGKKDKVYDILAGILGWPVGRTIRRYSVSNSNEPDGMMHSNLIAARELFNNKFGGDVAVDDFRRHGVLAFDAMHTKGRFGVCRNTGEIVAIADDALDEDALVAELRELEKNDGEDEDADVKLPGIAKHFLIFMFTTWSGEAKIQFLAARHSKKSMTGPLLRKEITEVILGLFFYGFLVTQLGSDGASENRSAFKLLATISAKEILSKIWSAKKLEGLPLDFKIGFEFPHRLLGNKITVIIGGEMPHWVKKVSCKYDIFCSVSYLIFFISTIYSFAMHSTISPAVFSSAEWT